MESKKNKKEFRFVKRKLTFHNSKIQRIASNKRMPMQMISPSPKKKRNMLEQEKSVKKIREIYLKNKKGFIHNRNIDLDDYEEPELNYNLVTNFLLGQYDEELKKLIHILISPYSERNEEEKNYLYSFLMKTKINEILKTDKLITDLNIQQLYGYFKPYIFGKCCNFMESIYYTGEEADNLYVVLHGSLGQYRLEVYEEELTAEEYYMFLSDCYSLYEEEKELGYILTEQEEPKKAYKIKSNIYSHEDEHNSHEKKINNENSKNEEKKEVNIFKDEFEEEYDEEDNKEQYIDHYLVCQMVDENKEVYPLRDIADLVGLKKIIFKLRLHTVLSDLKLRDAELLYLYYEFPTTYLNFDKVLDDVVSISKYMEILSSNFKQYDYFYMKFLGPLKHKVKLMKYVKCSKNLEPYSYFGNFELINPRVKRNLTVRCDSEKCILLCIDKRMYSLAVYNANKKERDKELDMMHSSYLFRNTGKKYFIRRIFANFQIRSLFKDNLLFKQGQRMNHFVFIKEGILELSLQNISFIEFHNLIKQTKELLIKKGKEYHINMKEFFDFDTNVESKTFYNMNTIKGILNQKQNFIFQRNEKGIFGDYELFFKINALLTGTIISDRCILYYYEADKYKSLCDENYLLKESLRYNSFIKVKSLLKRMIMVYNSYWRLSIEQLTKNLKEKEKIINILNDEEKEQVKRTVFNSTNLKNTPFIDNISNHKSYDKYLVTQNLNSSKGNNILLFKGNNKQILTNNLNIQNSPSRNKYKENENNSLRNNGDYRKSTKYNFTESNSQSKIPNKIINEKKIFTGNNFAKKGLSMPKNIKNDFGKEEPIDYKSINDEEYQKQLIKDFKRTVNAQRVASKKEQKKVFLPPLNYSSRKSYNPLLSTEFHSIKKNNFRIIKRHPNRKSNKNNEFIDNSKNLNDSLIINNSFSEKDKNKNIEEEKDEIQKTLNKIHDGYKMNLYKNLNTKTSTKNKFNFKLAQLYNIQLRKDKINNSLERSSTSFN